MTERMWACLFAIHELEQSGRARITANAIAARAAHWDPTILDPTRRHGNGAVKGTWSGTQARCQRILGSLAALHREKLVYRMHPPDAFSVYHLYPETRDLVERQLAERSNP